MLVDIHAHLDAKSFKKDLDKVIERAKEAKVSVIINNGSNIESNRKTLEISKKYPIVKPALGLFPWDALELSEEEIYAEIDFIKKEKPFAIGEVGLDYLKSKDKKQKIVFEKFIELSEKLKIPIIIHSRKAEQDCLDMLSSSKSRKIILHCFNGNKKQIKFAEDKNFMFSIPTIIKRSKHFQDLVKKVSLKNILTETDSPFLAPFEKTRNEPAFIKETIKQISVDKKLNEEEVEKMIFMNFQHTFLVK
ncbi:MAG: TatD family hydrolase [Nanoarchaeota archaeon]|nr:TatD family hydrolase [Nanoarchaeota archaeon]MBU1444834.1 TatD family hydrolase [Nanoarchaeota archaeon]MBU2406660.1 TatD family hydrolase [Nanoarchaeota archaeon]MBU2420002.1 TatD family hydrolase [Nanoarchaeota archaeon]MBU2475431.1 TatD family hydrolase [Nanoarchaeota archaeon]